MKFEWKDKYYIGIPEIDKQHKKLFSIAKKTYDLYLYSEEEDCHDDMLSALNDLIDYTRYHFNFEEKYIKSIHPKEFSKHKEEHDYYLDKLELLSNIDIEKNQKESLLLATDLIYEWANYHIKFSDRIYTKKQNKTD